MPKKISAKENLEELKSMQLENEDLENVTGGSAKTYICPKCGRETHQAYYWKQNLIYAKCSNCKYSWRV